MGHFTKEGGARLRGKILSFQIYNKIKQIDNKFSGKATTRSQVATSSA